MQQQHRPLARPAVGADRQTNKQTNKHPGTTIRLTIRDATDTESDNKGCLELSGAREPIQKSENIISASFTCSLGGYKDVRMRKMKLCLEGEE